MKQVFYAKIPSSPSPLLTIKYESKTYFELPAARSTPHGELRISMFFWEAFTPVLYHKTRAITWI